jgi:ABC-2 type transport system ATP-binding protein
LSGLNDSGRTVVLTTHYMDEAEVLCDRVAIMDQGRILELDSPTALVRGLQAPVRISVAHPLGADGLGELPGVVMVTDDAAGCTITTREPSAVLSTLAAREQLDGLQVRGATLEDVFLQLTGRDYRA